MAEKILIIDDDIETLRLMGIMLKRQGYQIFSAMNGSDGISRAINEKPNLIILDLLLPDLDGLAITKKLRDNPATSSIPIIIFTVSKDPVGKEAGLKAGADEYLIKPVRPPELINSIKTLLTRQKTVTAEPLIQKALVMGFLSGIGGQGVSTLVYNLALSLIQKQFQSLLAAELRPGLGSWASDYSIKSTTSIENLLALPVTEITEEAVKQQILKSPQGISCLLASSKIFQASSYCESSIQMETILNHLVKNSQLLLLDIGSPSVPGFEKILSKCDDLYIISEPQPLAIRRTLQLFEELSKLDQINPKSIQFIIVNRYITEVQLSALQIQDSLGQPIYLVIPPVPELAYQSAMRNLPLIQLQSDSLYAQQLNRLTELLIEKLNA